MDFAEKLKTIRKQSGMSQEQLAEKLGVSRQAVTKWETDTGIPDIENIIAISKLFGISIDELLSNQIQEIKKDKFLFESVTEYDIAEPKHYDMKFGGAKQLVLSGYKGEKIRVCLASNTLSTLQNDFKLKIDDIKGRIDVDLSLKNGVTEANAKEALYIFVYIPSPYIGKIECSTHADEILVCSIECNSLELDVKASSVVLEGVVGEVDITCNLDMQITCKTLNGIVELNQISSTSKIILPEDIKFTAMKKGIGNSIYFEKDGKTCDPFDEKGSDNIIKLKGIKSELIICKANF